MGIEIQGMAPLIQVYDMPRSLRFYRDVLGFEMRHTSSPGDDCDWAWLHFGDAELMLNTAYERNVRPPAPDRSRTAAHSDLTLYFGCEDLDSACAHLRSHGVDAPDPKIAPYGMRQVYVKDPDGYLLCFQWPAGEGDRATDAASCDGEADRAPSAH